MIADERPRLGKEQGRLLARLHTRQFEPMVRMAARSLPPPSRANAEDIVQTVFAEAVATVVRRPTARIGEVWLIRRLRSRIIDYHRRAGRQRRLLTAVAGAEVVATEAAATAEEIVLDRSAVDALLATIPDRDDQFTLIFKLWGLSEAEIAARMSLPLEGRRVRDRLQKVRKQARAARRADEPPPVRILTGASGAGPPPRVRGPAGRT
jgi:DNA-directed RNA polymerase specialized sigma24 family protein